LQGQLGVALDVLDLGRAGLGTDRHVDHAEPQVRQQHRHRRRIAAGAHAHPIAGADVPRPQPGTVPARQLVELGPGPGPQRAVFDRRAQGNPTRITGGEASDQRRHRPDDTLAGPGRDEPP
jgi:hypothetical protein